jgi:hypothetical protein
MDHAPVRPTYEIHASTHIKAALDDVYRVASDITRMGEWSPECTGGEWTEGEPGALGARFRGHNQVGERTWNVECQVVDSEPGRRFAWAVLTAAPDADTAVWSFEVEEDVDGSTLTQRFVMQQPTEGLLSIMSQLPPEKAETFLDDRRANLQRALHQTIDGIKKSIEQ